MSKATQVIAAQDAPVAPVSDASNVLQVISRAAADPNVDIEKLERLLAMQERITAKHAESEFNAALNAAQTEIGTISADAENSQTKSRYATYAKLDKVLRPIYTRHGFSLSFDETDSPKPDHIRVLAILAHRGGHSHKYQKDMPADGKGAKGGDVMTKTHAAGAAASYGMRYLLKGIFNVAIGEEDTDGNEPRDEPRISEDQAATLQALMEEVGADKARFFAYLKIGALEEIHARNYASVVKLLESKRARS